MEFPVKNVMVLRVIWQCSMAFEADYLIFVHLIDGDVCALSLLCHL